LAGHFITGGAGFIGSHLADRLLAEGQNVTVYDSLISGKNTNIEHNLNKKNFHFIQSDLLDLESLKKAMKGHEVVWHLGANTDIPGGNKNTDIDLKNCTIATWNVLEAMRGTGVSKILFASSSTVYGDVPLVALKETSGPLFPISLYGAGKLACEGLLSSYSHLFGIKVWMFRFGNVLGARMGHGVIHDFINKLRNNPKELEILGDGNQEKNYFLIEDCLDGITCAFQKSKTDCDVFNLGCTATIKVRDIGRVVAEEMGLKDVKFRFTGGIRGWAGDAPYVMFNLDKIAKLGWQSKHSSEEAVRIATGRLLGKT
jgi:UDP-glucose 4-epimerase